jgi:hypothetical protein
MEHHRYKMTTEMWTAMQVDIKIILYTCYWKVLNEIYRNIHETQIETECSRKASVVKLFILF